jgi:hypothetical protein
MDRLDLHIRIFFYTKEVLTVAAEIHDLTKIRLLTDSFITVLTFFYITYRYFTFYLNV